MLFGPQLPENQKPHQQFPRVANGVYPKRTKQIFSICYFHNEMTLSVSLSHEIPGTFKHITLACAFVLFLFFFVFFCFFLSKLPLRLHIWKILLMGLTGGISPAEVFWILQG